MVCSSYHDALDGCCVQRGSPTNLNGADPILGEVHLPEMNVLVHLEEDTDFTPGHIQFPGIDGGPNLLERDHASKCLQATFRSGLGCEFVGGDSFVYGDGTIVEES